MLFNDRRNPVAKLQKGLEALNDQKITNKKGPFDLRNSSKKLRKNISKVNMQGAYGMKSEQPTRKNEWK